jgi:AAA domain
MSSDPDHIKLMEDVVPVLLGEPNGKPEYRKRSDLRFGKQGSMSVNLDKGTWFSHEDNEGGGVIDLIMREEGLSEPRDAYEWAEKQGFWTNGKLNGGSPAKAKIVATYDYTDENGVLLFQVVRFDPKNFSQRRPAKVDDDPKDIKDDWVWKVAGVRRVPYCLPRLIKAVGNQIIYICEGEKDCINLNKCGLVASTNPGGANKWQAELTPHFKGADVVIITDNDDAGHSHAPDVARKLKGTAKRIRLLDLGTVWPECPVKGDISDWLEGGHSSEELSAIVAKLSDFKETVSSRLGVLDAGDDTTLPPPRAWLYGNIFARKFLSSLFGDGGVGKTALRYAHYLSLATGRSLAGDYVFQRCRVLIISLEDDMDELRRRIWALRIHYNISEADLKGWLFLWAPGAKGGKLMELDAKGNPKLGELSANLELLIVENKLDLVGIDPFIKSHGVGENNNNAIDLVVQVLADLMFKHNISVDVPHHVSKPGLRGEPEPGDANRGRGASSLKDAARLVYTLNVMTKEEATKTFGIPEHERFAYIRMDKGKVNITKPSRKASWFRLVGVELGNDTEMYRHGDEVQAVEAWIPCEILQDISDEQADAIIAEIDKGMSDGDRYSNAASAKRRAASQVVMRHVKGKTEKQARDIVEAWIKGERLVSQEYMSPVSRKTEQGLFKGGKQEEIPF